MTSRRLLMLIAGAGVVALLWKEFPAMVRYYKIERM
jgi:hypothetical protein